MGLYTVRWDEPPQVTLIFFFLRKPELTRLKISFLSLPFEPLVNLTLKITAPIKSRRWECNTLPAPHKRLTLYGGRSKGEAIEWFFFIRSTK